MGTTTSDTTFVVSKDGKHIKWMAMSLWKRTYEKAEKWDAAVKGMLILTGMDDLEHITDFMAILVDDVNSLDGVNKKLKAVEKWLEDLKKITPLYYIPDAGIAKLEAILRSSTPKATITTNCPSWCFGDHDEYLICGKECLELEECEAEIRGSARKVKT